MAIVGKAYVEVRALDDKLERDIDRALQKIKDHTVKVGVSLNPKQALIEFDKLKTQLEKETIKIKVALDTEGIKGDIEKIRKQQEHNAINVDVNGDTSKLEEAIQKVNKSGGGKSTSKIIADADTAAAEAKLGFAARPRTAKITAGISIPDDISEAAKRLGYTIAGAIPAETIRAAVTNVAGNLESLLAKLTVVSAGMGALSAEALTLGANLLVLGGDVTKAVGLVAMYPAALSAIALAVSVNSLVFKDFAKAAGGNEKALAKLPPAAQEAAKMFKGLGDEMRKPVQNAFWEKAIPGMKALINDVIPPLIKGMTGTATVFGTVTTSVSNTMAAFARSGGLSKLLDNINKGFENAGRGAAPFVQALNTLALTGSKYLITFGTYLADMAVKFNNFITAAEKTGKIDRWIGNAVTTIKQLGSVAASTVNILKGLTLASRLSGGRGLEDFKNGLKGVAETVNSEPFRTKLVTILQGARHGAEQMGKGFADIRRVIGDSSEGLKEFIKISGNIGGQFLTNISKVMDGTNFGAGLVAGLRGLETAMKKMEPGFQSIGHIIGDLGEIAGVVVPETADGLVHLLDTVSKIIDGLKEGVKAVVPIFNDFMQAVFSALSGPVIELAKGVGNLLQTFASLPGPIRDVIMALGLGLAIAPKLISAFEKVGVSLSKVFGKGEYAKMSKDELKAVADSFEKAGKEIPPKLTKALNAPPTIGQSYKVMSATVAAEGRNLAASFKQIPTLAALGMRSSFGVLKGQIDKSFGDVARTFKSGFSQGLTAANPFGDISSGFKKDMAGVRAAVDGTRAYIVKGFSGIGSAVSSGAGAARGMFAPMADSARAYATAIRTTFSSALEGISSSRGATALKNVGRGIGESFAPASLAVRGFASQVSASMSTAATSVGNFTKNIASAGGSKLKAGLGGLMGVLGGPWGLALAGATTALALFAQGQADAKAQVDELAKSLGSQGQVTDDTRKKLAGMITDASDSGDAWQNFWRGAIEGSKAGGETITAMGKSTKEVTDLVAKGGTEFDNYKGNIDKVRDAMDRYNNNLGGSKEQINQLGKELLGVDNIMDKVNSRDLTHLSRELEGAASQLGAAREQTKQLAEAMGVSSVNAGILQNNWSILASETSTVDQRFGALKQNLDIVNNSMRNTADITRNTVANGKVMEQTFNDLRASLKNYGASAASLYSVKDGFKFGADGAMELYDAVSKATDGILSIGAATQDAAIKSGKTVNEANQAAIKAMQPMIDNLRGTLREMGLAEPQIKGIIDLMGLTPEKLTTAFEAKTEDAKKNILELSLAAQAYASGNYEAVLAALPDAAQKAIADATGTADQFAKGEYKAVLEALDKTGGGREKALAQILKVTNGDYKAKINTIVGNEGILEAVSKIEKVTQGDYQAVIKAAAGVPGLDKVINDISNVKDGNYEAVVKANPNVPGLENVINTLANAVKAKEVPITPVVNQGAVATTQTITEQLAKGRQIDFSAVPNGTFQTTDQSANAIAAKQRTAFFGAATTGSVPATGSILDNVARGRTSSISAGMGYDGASGTLGSIARPRSAAMNAVQGSDNASNWLSGISVPRTVQIGIELLLNAIPGPLRSLLGLADGGVLNGAGIKAFANGGFENHTAQISRTPYRLWSEPETGGEAYIPLSAAKRGRSTQILATVADLFGMGLFADGGTVIDKNGRKTDSTVNTSSNGSGKTVIINNQVYPSAQLDEEQVAQSTADKIYWKIQNY